MQSVPVFIERSTDAWRGAMSSVSTPTLTATLIRQEFKQKFKLLKKF